MAEGDGERSEFLHAKSMLTPGAMGGATLTITNTLGNVFQLPLGIVALLVSALFAAMLWAVTESAALWQRIVFFLLNTLIIFCVAMGSNTAGLKIVQGRTQQASFSLLTPAYAQDSEAADRVVRDVESITQNPDLTAEEKLNEITLELEAAKPETIQQDSELPTKGFFRIWGF
ncbi:MAG: hypothetical protein AAGF48_08585 [Pseudomonadota bacterium]